MIQKYFGIIPLITLFFISSSCVQDVYLTCRSGSYSTTTFEDDFANKNFVEYSYFSHPDTIYYHYTGEKAAFIYGIIIENICPDNLVQAFYEASTSSMTQSPNTRIKAVADWSYSRFGNISAVTQFSTFGYGITPSTTYTDTFNILDLNEVFGENEAQVEFYIEFEFDKHDSFELDSAFFVNHIFSMKITAIGDRYFK